LSGITKQEYNLPKIDSAHPTEYRLLPSGFSPQTRLVSDIFRANNSCIHKLSNGLLICSVTFPYFPSSLHTLSRRAKELNPDHLPSRLILIMAGMAGSQGVRKERKYKVLHSKSRQTISSVHRYMKEKENKYQVVLKNIQEKQCKV
jgi:hypothetical protein